MAVEAGVLEPLDDHREVLRRGREVVDAAERVTPCLTVERVDFLRDRRVALVIVERDAEVAQPLHQAVEYLLVGLAARELVDRLAREVAELVVGLFAARDAD